MTKFSLPGEGAFWRADGLAALALVLALITLHLTTDVFAGLERRFYDFASTRSARQPSDQIAIIAIDDESLASIGRWPWPRDLHARLIEQLAKAKANVIVDTGFFFEPASERGLPFIHQIKGLLAASEAAGTPSPLNQQLLGVIAAAEVALDSDHQLANSFHTASNVLISSLLTPGQQPIESLANAAAGVGHLKRLPDLDGVVRQEALLLNNEGQAVQSLALLAVARSRHLTAGDIQFNQNGSVQIGQLRLRTGGAARLLPLFYQGRDGQPAFALDSFADVLSGKIPASRYAGKIVLIGVTAAGVGTAWAVPGHPALSSTEILAHVTSSILQEQFVVQPGWGRWVTWGLLLLVGAYLIAVLPRLPIGRAVSVTLLSFMALLGIEFGLLAGMALWLPLVFPALLLVSGHLALMIKRFLLPEVGTPTVLEESTETHRMMGLALQGQGQLDMAFEHFRRVPAGDALMGNLYGLALDFERKRQFNMASVVREHMAALRADRQDEEHFKPTVDPAESPSKIAMLGRYQLERELGKGAMGVVYQGRDPKIGRVVAIKTMALSEEFAGKALADARERFFREAQTAGRLQHPNIVTIYDAGEDHELAYIAMEFLNGKDLTHYCKGGQLLPVSTVLSIVARVAEALGYAHKQQVVHRDIKPANIMFDLEHDAVKVTDFGIARITDASKTRTGLVLGTPSFMSPEQLTGKKVDGRTDLYSLGVMLFQLLTGVLPFRAESMAELMHKIANEEAPSLRSIRPELPQRLASLVARLLGKRPEARYQDGDQLARDLRAVLSGGNNRPENTA